MFPADYLPHGERRQAKTPVRPSGTFYRAADVLALCEYEEPAHGPLEWEHIEKENKALSEENRALKEKLSRIYEFLREAVKL